MPEQSTTINPGQSLGRAFDNFVFYFELSESHHPILYPISKLLPRYGAVLIGATSPQLFLAVNIIVFLEDGYILG